MRTASAIHLHIERVIIDEAVHQAGPAAIHAALAGQLPALLAEHGAGGALAAAGGASLSRHAAGRIAARIPSISTTGKK
jgi:hypothetical protein